MYVCVYVCVYVCMYMCVCVYIANKINREVGRAKDLSAPRILPLWAFVACYRVNFIISTFQLRGPAHFN
jgi:hypothetical protein